MPDTELGERIRRLRLARNLTLKQVGDKANVSPTHLSEIERGKTSPTVGALVRIALALGREPARLVDDDAARAVSLVRREERRSWSQAGATISSLSRGIHPAEISILEIAVSAGDDGRVDLPGDTGEALLVVLDGEIAIDVQGRRHHLRPGDAIHVGLADAHGLHSTGSPARVLCVARPPLVM